MQQVLTSLSSEFYQNPEIKLLQRECAFWLPEVRLSRRDVAGIVHFGRYVTSERIKIHPKFLVLLVVSTFISILFVSSETNTLPR